MLLSDRVTSWFRRMLNMLLALLPSRIVPPAAPVKPAIEMAADPGPGELITIAPWVSVYWPPWLKTIVLVLGRASSTAACTASRSVHPAPTALAGQLDGTGATSSTGWVTV